jgi:flagellum-specific ATP synthase
VLPSVSRLMNDLVTPEHVAATATIRRLLAVYEQHEDVLSLGAYRRGSNPEVDVAVEMREAIEALFRQDVVKSLPFDQVVGQLNHLAAQCRAALSAASAAA